MVIIFTLTSRPARLNNHFSQCATCSSNVIAHSPSGERPVLALAAAQIIQVTIAGIDTYELAANRTLLIVV